MAAGVLRGLQGQRDPGQRRAQAVVQLAAQAPALLLPGGDDRLARVLDLGRHPQRVEHEGELAHQHFGEREVGGPVVLAGRPRADDEPPQRQPAEADGALDPRLAQLRVRPAQVTARGPDRGRCARPRRRASPAAPPRRPAVRRRARRRARAARRGAGRRSTGRGGRRGRGRRRRARGSAAGPRQRGAEPARERARGRAGDRRRERENGEEDEQGADGDAGDDERAPQQQVDLDGAVAQDRHGRGGGEDGGRGGQRGGVDRPACDRR